MDIYGTRGYDRLDGTDDDDKIFGYALAEGPGSDTGADVINGGAGDDEIHGDGGNDRIDGGRGADKIYGDAGDDTLRSSGASEIYGGAGNDTISITGSAKLLDGGDGNDRIFSARGAYTIINGGTGNDYIRGSVLPETINGGDGDDTIFSGGVSDWNDYDVINGGAGNDRIFGSDGADRIDGGSGNDTIFTAYTSDIEDFFLLDQVRGGDGNDIIVMQGIDATLYGDAGSDVIRNLSGFSATMFGGTGNDTLIAGLGSDTMYGEDGNDVLNATNSLGIMEGGRGNDVYIVDSEDDQVTEAAGAGSGNDEVRSSVNWTLSANVETLTLTGNAAINGTGNASNNAITGNNQVNTLSGLVGNDTLDGKGGRDILTGGVGNDAFLFTTAITAANVDRITDFSNVRGNRDSVHLDDAVFLGLSTGALSPDAFKDLGQAGAVVDSTDRILYNSTTGALSFDRDGSGQTYAAVLFATIDNYDSLRGDQAVSAANFLVV